MRWRQPVPGRGAEHTVEGRLTVALRLNLSPWLDRGARLYMSLAPTDGDRLTARWRTHGRLLAGTLRGGERALVYEGQVRDAFLQEELALELSADGRAIDRAKSLQFFFEIELSP